MAYYDRRAKMIWELLLPVQVALGMMLMLI